MATNIKKFSTVMKAASNLSSGTYTGTMVAANKQLNKFSTVMEASANLSSGTYSGTVVAANVPE